MRRLTLALALPLALLAPPPASAARAWLPALRAVQGKLKGLGERLDLDVRRWTGAWPRGSRLRDEAIADGERRLLAQSLRSHRELGWLCLEDSGGAAVGARRRLVGDASSIAVDATARALAATVHEAQAQGEATRLTCTHTHWLPGLDGGYSFADRRWSQQTRLALDAQGLAGLTLRMVLLRPTLLGGVQKIVVDVPGARQADRTIDR